MRNKTILLVFAGGAIGSLLRAFLTAFGADLTATFLVNFLGACALGLVQHAPQFDTPLKQAFYATGFCGGFTTLSGISLFFVFGNSNLMVSTVFTVASVVAGLLGYWLWAKLGKTFRTTL